MLYFVLFVSYFEKKKLEKIKSFKKKKRKKVLKNMMSKKYMHTSTADSARIVKKKEIDVVSMYIRTKKERKKTTTTKNTSIKIYIY